MLRHPSPSVASPERLAAFHEEVKRTPHRWRACPLLRIEPVGSRFREVRRCPLCNAELVRRLQSVVLRYADSSGTDILPPASVLLTVPVGTSLAQSQQEAIRQVYELVGSVQIAAQLLGVSRRSLYNWCPNLRLQEAEPHDLGVSVEPPTPRSKR